MLCRSLVVITLTRTLIDIYYKHITSLQHLIAVCHATSVGQYRFTQNLTVVTHLTTVTMDTSITLHQLLVTIRDGVVTSVCSAGL